MDLMILQIIGILISLIIAISAVLTLMFKYTQYIPAKIAFHLSADPKM